jgi:cation diffusion facilitator CzcD-associated flavoprotein CzcO/acetyl esterase/lipase
MIANTDSSGAAAGFWWQFRRRATHMAVSAAAPLACSPRLPLSVRRRFTDVSANLIGRPPKGTTSRRRTIGRVPGIWIEPDGAAPDSCILYLHGGGYVIGSARSHRNVVARLATAVGVPAFIPDYRLGPENPWPAAVTDAMAAYQGLLTEGTDPGRIVVAGDSAGGGLALVVAMAIRDAGHPAPAMVAMVCPWLDVARDRSSEPGDGVLSGDALAAFAADYVPEKAKRTDSSASPLHGRLDGLPPLIVHAASRDLLADDARRLARLATEAGATVELVEYPGLWHAFHLCAGLLPDADRAIERLAGSIRSHLFGARTPEVLIVGAGMSGLCMGAKLKAAGIDSFTILEKAGTVGGTWRENTYPGLTCDLPSRYYSFSFLPNPAWSRLFSPGPEIGDYFVASVDKLGLRPHIVFGAQVTKAVWTGNHWEVETADGTARQADVVVTATGVLHHPRYPDIKGLDSFSGAVFHSARWDHSVPLEGRRVAVIGTGSTGTQIVSALAGVAGRLFVIQRTAQWVLRVPNHRYGQLTRRLMSRFPGCNRAAYHGYRIFIESLSRGVTNPGLARWALSTACRLSLRLSVRDPELRRRLTPDHEPMCRRLIFTPGFYPAVQRPDVDLITEDIECIESDGIRLRNGDMVACDVIVLATGFDAHAYMRPITILGEAGLTLDEAWADGPHAYRTVALPGFPNLFMLIGPHSPVGNNSLITIAESQADYALTWIERIRRGEIHHVAPSPAATETYNDELRAALPRTRWASGCTSWYIGKDGLPELWPWSPRRHRTLVREVEERDHLVARSPEVDVTKAVDPPSRAPAEGVSI